MPSTLATPSFIDINLRERTKLRKVAAKGAVVLEVESTSGYTSGQTIYIGALGREECEKVVIQAVTDADTLTVVSGLLFEHGQFEDVTGVLGYVIHVRRALDVDGSVPADDLFAHLAYRTINPEAPMTYYTDSAGSASYWYRATYFNPETNEETDLSSSRPVRGDDFGHYASLSAIRSEAGFDGATRLSEVTINQQRRIAESEINATLGDRLTVPFVKPVPEIITTITVLLAAGLLQNNAYGSNSKVGDTKIATARAMLKSVGSGESSTGDPGNVVASGVSGDFGDEPRMFSVADRF